MCRLLSKGTYNNILLKNHVLLLNSYDCTAVIDFSLVLKGIGIHIPQKNKNQVIIYRISWK